MGKSAATDASEAGYGGRGLPGKDKQLDGDDGRDESRAWCEWECGSSTEGTEHVRYSEHDRAAAVTWGRVASTPAVFSSCRSFSFVVKRPAKLDRPSTHRRVSSSRPPRHPKSQCGSTKPGGMVPGRPAACQPRNCRI